MTAFLFIALILLMLMGFALYTAVAAAFFLSVPLICRELQARYAQARQRAQAAR